MKRVLLVVSAIIALAVPANASSHFGNIWYQSATWASVNVERAGYTEVYSARCVRPDAALIRATRARSFVRNGVRYWNHLPCRLKVLGRTKTCWVLFHQTGRNWYAFVLTRYPLRDGNSCSPYDIGYRYAGD